MDEVREYRLTTVTYGLACSPFLAICILRQLAAHEIKRFPLGAQVLQRDVYVDNVVTSAHYLLDAQKMQTELSELCAASGFPL